MYQVAQTLRDTVPAEAAKRTEGQLPKIFDPSRSCEESEEAFLDRPHSDVKTAAN